MNRESAMRAIKRMPLPVSGKTTPRAVLGGVLRINSSNGSLSLNLVADYIEDHTIWPYREPSIPSFAASLAPAEIQILKYKNAVLRSPFDKLLGCTIAEILSSTRSLDSQPFEGSDNTPSILSLCLSLSKFSLESLDRLRSALVLDLPIQATYEKLISICVYSHYSIGFVEVNSHRMNSLNIWKFNRVGNVTNKLVSKILDCDAIDLRGIIIVLHEGIRNHIMKAFSAIDCGNAQKTILHEIGITPPLSNKKESKRSMPVERMIEIMIILFGRCISASSKPDACAGKLARYGSFDIIVDSAMQIKSFQRLAEVPSSFGYAIADLSKAIECFDERFIRLNNYLQGSLNKHQLGDTTMIINTSRISGGV